jgi:hypothetical protein
MDTAETIYMAAVYSPRKQIQCIIDIAAIFMIPRNVQEKRHAMRYTQL